MNEKDFLKSITKTIRIKPVHLTILHDYGITPQQLFDRAVEDYFKETVNKKQKFVCFKERKWNKE
jgi:hypothetical protein